MNRRKVLQVFLISGISLTSFSAVKWFLQPGWDENIDFLKKQKPLLAELAELIIPRTGSPGAKDAKVEDFIFLMLKDSTGQQSLTNFVKGLRQLADYATRHYNRPFIACTSAQQTAILKVFEEKGKAFNGIAGKVEQKLLGKSFFTTLKNYTVMGYCTSLQGATYGLAYDPVPGNYVACYPVTPGQRSWATK